MNDFLGKCLSGKERRMMAQGNLKIKISSIKLVKELENHKKKLSSKYESDLKNYAIYKVKQANKILAEVRKISSKIEELDFSDIKNEYREQISIKLNTNLKELPTKPHFSEIDRRINFIKLSSKDEITLSQDEYNYLFR